MILRNLARRSACCAVLLSGNLALAAPPGVAPSATPQPATPQPATPQPADPQAADPQAADPQPADPQAEALDEVQLTSGELVHGRVTDLAEGAYVTIVGAKGTQTFPWPEVARVRLERGKPEDAVELSLAARGFEVDLPVTADSPYIEMQTRDGRPMSLLRLRNTGATARERYSTGFDEVCRAPCRRPVAAGNRRFFVDSHPWTASKMFDLPSDQKYLRLLVRPGNVKLRKAGVGLMIGGAVGFVLGIFMISLPRKSMAVSGAGITILTFSSFAIPTGGLLFGVSRSKVRIEPMTGLPATSQAN